MMSVIGFAILAVVFAGIFWATTLLDGWRLAAMIWGFSILTTGAIVLGVALATGALS
jgi:hypothetical protein